MKKLLTLFLMLGAFNCMATPVNINTADAATIADALHGVGMVKAQEIVAYRQANGAFKSLEDLGNVKGIGDKTLTKNQADILFDGVAAAPVATTPAAAAAPKAPVVATPVAVPAVAAPAIATPVAPAPVAVKKAAKTKAKAAAAAIAPAVPVVAPPAITSPVANPLQ
ncbi:MAG: helix-hairpin-helix domain-containing protein [Methylococcaceae bacterium]